MVSRNKCSHEKHTAQTSDTWSIQILIYVHKASERDALRVASAPTIKQNRKSSLHPPLSKTVTGTTEDTAYTGPIAICNTAKLIEELEQKCFSESNQDFGKSIFLACGQLFCSGNTERSGGLDLTVLVESSESICKNHHLSICDLIKMQGISSMQLSTGIEKRNSLVDSVTKVIWIQIAIFLEGNLASFVSICEDRPNSTWRRHVARIAVQIAKYFSFPEGVLNPFKFDDLQSYVGKIIVPICKFLFDNFTPPAGLSDGSSALSQNVQQFDDVCDKHCNDNSVIIKDSQFIQNCSSQLSRARRPMIA